MSSKRLRIAIGVVLGLMAFGLVVYKVKKTDRSPAGLILGDHTDVSPEGYAARATRVVGHAQIVGEPKELAAEDQMKIRDVLRVSEKSFVQLMSHGNWIIGVDGPAEVSLEDAVFSAGQSEHQIRWNLREGTLRTKPYRFATGTHSCLVTTPRSTVEAKGGEFGLRINNGGGQIWVIQGSVDVTTGNEPKKTISEKQMGYL